MTVWKSEGMPEGEGNWFLLRVGAYVPTVVHRIDDNFYDGTDTLLRFVDMPMTWTEIPA